MSNQVGAETISNRRYNILKGAVLALAGVAIVAVGPFGLPGIETFGDMATNWDFAPSTVAGLGLIGAGGAVAYGG